MVLEKPLKTVPDREINVRNFKRTLIRFKCFLKRKWNKIFSIPKGQNKPSSTSCDIFNSIFSVPLWIFY